MKNSKIFYLEITRCRDCPYGSIPICDLTNDEKYDSSQLHPKCPLLSRANSLNIKKIIKLNKSKLTEKIFAEIRGACISDESAKFATEKIIKLLC